MEKNIFKKFIISGNGQEIGVSHIQYADDTILVGEMFLKNVWALKCILRNFELAAGLKVNFHKSGLIGLKFNQRTVDHVTDILNCIVGPLPFKFLGILVGANPRRSASWYPLNNTIQNRLQGWRNRFLSFSGRVILINVVLSSLSIYYISFYRAPKQVANKIIKI